MNTREIGDFFNLDRVKGEAHKVLDLPGAAATEIVITNSVSGLTRYARSGIIQNTNQETVRAYVRVATGKATASVSTNQMDAAHLEAAAQRALEAARVAPEDPEFVGFPAPDVVGRPTGIFRFDPDTSTTSPGRRAAEVRKILGLTTDVDAAGIFETSAHAVAIFSSEGMDCSDAYTRCVASCLADNGESTGWREGAAYRLEDVDVESGARPAVSKGEAGRNKNKLETGTYEVVLEPAAVAMLIEYLSYSGFGAKQVIDGESFLSTRSGQRVAAESVTITDDVDHSSSIGIGFDFEGVPKQKVAVIESGVARGPVTDFRTAQQLGVRPTGHSSGSAEFGPFAANVVMERGAASLEDMLTGVSDGVLVTRFHYVNILDRPSVLLTGMTRDGTFRLQDGEIAGPVHNLRFAHSALDALDTVQDIGADLEAFVPEFSSFGSTVAPALRVGSFH